MRGLVGGVRPGCHGVSGGDSRSRPGGGGDGGGGGVGGVGCSLSNTMSDTQEQTRPGGVMFDQGEVDLSPGFVKMGARLGWGGWRGSEEADQL